MTHEIGGETVEDENKWTTNKGKKFTNEILERFLQQLQTNLSRIAGIEGSYENIRGIEAKRHEQLGRRPQGT
jgi:hypothetical protein